MTVLRRLGLLALVLYVAVGLAWSLRHLGEIPHYGDTLEYLMLAEKFQTHQHRGFLYPWILRGTCRAFLDGEVPRDVSFKEEEKAAGGLSCVLPPEFAFLQVFQVLLSIACFAYFIHVVWPRQEGARGPPFLRPGPWIVLTLLVFDPLLHHFNLSLMTDGLTASAALAFCAALADLGLRRSPPLLAGILLLTSSWVCAGLRVEKKWILLATAAITVLVWRGLKRWGFPPGRRGLGRRSVGAALLVVLSVALAIGIQKRNSYVSRNWWSLGETTVHFRLVFPHLSEVYEDLSEETRAVVSQEDAELYDRHINNVRRVVNRATKGNEERRHELTRDFLRTVVPRKWPTIAFDVVRDTLENVFVTVPFYVRVGIWQVGGYRRVDKWFDSGIAVWDYTRLRFHHGELSGWLIWLFAAVFLVSLPVALRDGWSYVRSGDLRALVPWTPALSFWVLNALSFAMAVNVINVRYMLTSHAFFLCFVYISGVRWSLRPEGDDSSGGQM